MLSMPQLRYTIPTFLFFSVCGFYFIVVQMALSHAPDRFLEVHKASHVPLYITNHTFPLLDKILDPLISFFVAAFGNTDSPAYTTVVDFVWSFGCAIQIPLVEAQRPGVNARNRSFATMLIAYPMVWGILYQRLSGGWILPLWLLAFMHSRTRASGIGLSRANAESVFAGWWLGHTLPALAMLIPGQPALCKAPIWIAFPILMSVFQNLYLFIRTRFFPPAKDNAPGSGYFMLQLTYLSAFFGSVLAHVHIVLIPALGAAPALMPTHEELLNKVLGLVARVYAFFAPATGLGVPPPAKTTAASGVIHFVQFDVLVVFAAVWIALLWDLALRRKAAREHSCSNPESCGASKCTGSYTPRTQSCTMGDYIWVAKFVLALLAGALLLSPGAATSALLMYREALLDESSYGLAL